MKMNYLVVYGRAPNNYCAYSPDVPGCISTGADWEDMQRMMHEAVTGHVEFLILDGDPLPKPRHSIIDGIRDWMELGDDPSEYDDTEEEITFGFLEVEINPQPSWNDFDVIEDEDAIWGDDDDDWDDGDSRRRAEVDPSICKFAVVYERTANGYRAFVPELHGCIVENNISWTETKESVGDAVRRRLESISDSDDPAHEPRMSLTDAMRYYIELMEDPFLTEGYTPPDYDEQVTFSFVEVEVDAPQSAERLETAGVSDD